MNFREAFTDDLEGFLDIEEFAQIHLIEGSEVKAIVKNVSNSKKKVDTKAETTTEYLKVLSCL